MGISMAIPSREKKEQRRADARLIAAAPETAAERDRLKAEKAELLVALELIEVDLTAGDISAKARVALAFNRVRAVLTKVQP